MSEEASRVDAPGSPAKSKEGSPAKGSPAKAPAELEATPVRTGARERKTVQRYSDVHAATPKERKVEVPEGPGTKLREVELFQKYFAKVSAQGDAAKRMHKAMYGFDGKQAERKKNINSWNGCSPEKVNEIVKVLAETKLSAVLKQIAATCGLKVAGTKDDLADRVAEFLQKPSESAMVVKEKKKKAAKKKGVKKTIKKGAKKDPSAPKKPMTAYFFYLGAKRDTVREKNPDLDMKEVAKAIAAKWNSMDDAKKKPYQDMYEEAKEKYAEQMKAYKPKGKAAKKSKKDSSDSDDDSSAPAKKKKKKDKKEKKKKDKKEKKVKKKVKKDKKEKKKKKKSKSSDSDSD